MRKIGFLLMFTSVVILILAISSGLSLAQGPVGVIAGEKPPTRETIKQQVIDTEMEPRLATVVESVTDYTVPVISRKEPNPQDEHSNVQFSVKQLSQEQMKNAVTVQDGRYASRVHLKGEIYRLESCKQGDDSQVPCYFTIVHEMNVRRDATKISPNSINTTIICGVDVYNRFGAHLGRLQQNVNTTFIHNTYHTPVIFNWGDLQGTWALPGYVWSNLQGPNPNPAWGQRSGGYASLTASGELHLLIHGFPIWGYFSTRLIINKYGWYCQ